jgi:hypothetical protein
MAPTKPTKPDLPAASRWGPRFGHGARPVESAGNRLVQIRLAGAFRRSLPAGPDLDGYTSGPPQSR